MCMQSKVRGGMDDGLTTFIYSKAQMHVCGIPRSHLATQIDIQISLQS